MIQLLAFVLAAAGGFVAGMAFGRRSSATGIPFVHHSNGHVETGIAPIVHLGRPPVKPPAPTDPTLPLFLRRGAP